MEKHLCPFMLLMGFRMSEVEENSETREISQCMGKLRARVGRRRRRLAQDFSV